MANTQAQVQALHGQVKEVNGHQNGAQIVQVQA